MQASKEIALKRITNDNEELGECPLEGIGMASKDNDPMKSFIEKLMKSMVNGGSFMWAWFGKNGLKKINPWMDPYSNTYSMIIQMKEEENEAKEKEHKQERK